MPACAITSIGVDRPGIVAAVTGVLLDRGCNIEDTAMSILRGQFAMVMVVATPDGIGADELERALTERTASFDLVTTVRELHAGVADDAAYGEPWTVVVYGPDHPGIVHLVAARLADLGVNIVDVTTRVSGDAPPLYSMVMEVLLPVRSDAGAVEAALRAAAEPEGLTVQLTPADADIL